jgi:hypothetical protein
MDEDLPKDLGIEYLQNKQTIYYLDSIQVRDVLLNMLRMNKPLAPMRRKLTLAARL